MVSLSSLSSLLFFKKTSAPPSMSHSTRASSLTCSLTRHSAVFCFCFFYLFICVFFSYLTLFLVSANCSSFSNKTCWRGAVTIKKFFTGDFYYYLFFYFCELPPSPAPPFPMPQPQSSPKCALVLLFFVHILVFVFSKKSKKKSGGL